MAQQARVTIVREKFQRQGVHDITTRIMSPAAGIDSPFACDTRSPGLPVVIHTFSHRMKYDSGSTVMSNKPTERF
jgi:hypothetical protein